MSKWKEGRDEVSERDTRKEGIKCDVVVVVVVSAVCRNIYTQYIYTFDSLPSADGEKLPENQVKMMLNCKLQTGKEKNAKIFSLLVNFYRQMNSTIVSLHHHTVQPDERRRRE